MSWLNARSIQFRLVTWYSSLAAAVLLAFAAYTYHGVQAQLHANMERTLTRRAGQIAGMLAYENPASVPAHIHALYSPEANNRFIRILRADGTALYVSGAPRDGLFDPAGVPTSGNSVPYTRIQGGLLITDTPTAQYLIEMGAPIGEIEQPLHGLLRTLLYGLPVMIFIVSAGGYALVRRALQPVEAIRSTAQRITFGNLRNRLPVARTGDAIEHLSLTLNQMLARLEDAYEQASRFSADASHELRTPLTIMRGELEALARESELSLRLQERVGSVLEEAERLSRIAESLSAISRLDAGAALAVHAPCDLALLARGTAEQMALLAEEKRIMLHIDARSAPILGDAARLKQIVVNLLDNAIKYTPEGGNVWLKVAASGAAVLEVTDDGAGIPVAALPHVFERFYRADKARSREAGGAGLGLSIVRAIVQAHGGRVEIESTESRGTRCRVTLPLAESGA